MWQVFASCSTDKTIRVWDDRAQSHKANMITVADAHTADVNVINWNRYNILTLVVYIAMTFAHLDIKG